MATKQTDIKKLMEERIVSTNGELDKLKVGTDDFSKGARDLATIVRAFADLEKVRVQSEDDKERREEQKRMNDYEIEHKQAQIELDQVRAVNEREFRTNQTRITMGEVFMNAILGVGSQYLYNRAWHRSYQAEYQISDGASLQLPRSVDSSLKDLRPPKKKI